MNDKRFDHLISEANRQHSLMVKHSNGLTNLVRLLRRSAYRFAVAVLEIQKNCHNEFLDYCRSRGVSIDDWMEEHFGPVEAMGDHRRKLFDNIEQGMTEKEYVDQFTIWGVRQRQTAATGNRRAKADLDAAPPVAATPAEREAFMVAQMEAAKSETRELRRELREARADIARLITENERLNAAIKRMEKIIVNVERKAG